MRHAISLDPPRIINSEDESFLKRSAFSPNSIVPNSGNPSDDSLIRSFTLKEHTGAVAKGLPSKEE